MVWGIIVLCFQGARQQAVVDALRHLQQVPTTAYDAACGLSEEIWQKCAAPGFRPSLDKMKSFATCVFMCGGVVFLASVICSFVPSASAIGYVGSALNTLLTIYMRCSNKEERVVMDAIQVCVCACVCVCVCVCVHARACVVGRACGRMRDCVVCLYTTKECPGQCVACCCCECVCVCVRVCRKA
jgi:hypothetical protein